MNSRWNELWPPPAPPDDFALRVLVKTVELRPKPRRWLRVALAALVPSLCIAVALSLSFAQHQKVEARRAIVFEAQRKETEEHLRRLQSEFESANRREQELQASLERANDEVTRSKLQAELELARRKVARPAARALSVRGRATAAKSTCAPGDALCDQ